MTVTHDHGHTLDLIVTRSSENLLVGCFVTDGICDHSAVHCILRVHRPVRPRKKISFRRLKSTDIDQMAEDLVNLPLIIAPEDNIDGLLSQYNSGLSSMLGTHAALLNKELVVRPDNPWMTEEIRSARKQMRRLERRARRTRLEIEKEIYRSTQRSLRHLIESAKSSFLCTQIAESTGRISLFKIVDSLLLKNPIPRLPHHSSLLELVERFSCFFSEKISIIQRSFEPSSTLVFLFQPALALPSTSSYLFAFLIQASNYG